MEFLFEKKSDFYENIGLIYFYQNDLDKSIQYLWKSFKSCSNYLKLPYLYLYLGKAYSGKNDMKKAHQMFSNSKSCLGVFPLSDRYYKIIYINLIPLYANTKRFQEALECYEIVKKYYFNVELQEIKFTIGSIYYEDFKNDESLEIFTEINDFLSTLPQINKSFKITINMIIGELYMRKNNYKIAHYFFMEAFKLINYYKFFRLDLNLSCFIYTFNYFYNISEYEKCNIILSKALKLSKEKYYNRCVKATFIILRAKLYNTQKKIQEAKFYFNKAEKIMNIKEILLQPQINIKICAMQDIWFFLELTEFYISSYNQENYLKAEQILKHLETIYKVKFFSDWNSSVHIYGLFGNLYSQQARWNESKIWYEKALNLFMKNSSDAKTIDNLYGCIDYVDKMSKIKID